MSPWCSPGRDSSLPFRQHFYSADYLLVFCHPANNDQSIRGDDQSAMVHCWILNILLNRLPVTAFQVESKNHRRGFSWFAIQTYSVEVIREVAAAGEIDFLIPV